MDHHRRYPLFWGALLILAGALLFADKVTDLNLWYLVREYWPFFIILVGLYIILMNIGVKGKDRNVAGWNFGDKTIATDKDKVLQSNTFGDVKLSIENQDFQGGSIKTVFGDLKIDLVHTKIKEGEKTLYLTTTFGDIKVEATKRIPLAVRSSNTIGDISVFGQKRGGFGQTFTYKSEGYDEAPAKMAIITSQVFGDMKVW